MTLNNKNVEFHNFKFAINNNNNSSSINNREGISSSSSNNNINVEGKTSSNENELLEEANLNKNIIFSSKMESCFQTPFP